MILQYSSIWYASNAFENLLYQTMNNYLVLIYLEPKTQVTPKISCHRIDYYKSLSYLCIRSETSNDSAQRAACLWNLWNHIPGCLFKLTFYTQNFRSIITKINASLHQNRFKYPNSVCTQKQPFFLENPY